MVTEEEDKINNRRIVFSTLYSALFKLSFTFEINHSMATSLISEICNPIHTTFDQTFVAMKEWIKKYAQDVKLNVDEISCVIMYVKLYQYEPRIDEEEDVSEMNEADGILTCPYISNLPIWTSHIRRRQQSQSKNNGKSKRHGHPESTPSSTTRLTHMSSFTSMNEDHEDDEEIEGTLTS